MSQKEFFGFESIKHLQEILKQEDSRNIFLVTGKNYYGLLTEQGLREILQSIF